MSNSLSMAFVANAQTNQLMFCSSHDGSSWTAYVPIPLAANTPPSLMIFNGQFWMAYVSHDGNSVVVCSSPDGTSWSTSWTYYRQFLIAPSLAVFNNRLWMTVVRIDNSVEVYSCANDGLGWSASNPTGVMSKSSIGLVAFNNRLWMAFEALDGRNSLVVCSSTDGLHWSTGTPVGQLTKTAPSLTVFNNELWIAFVASNTTNALLVCSSPDGSTWSANTQVGPASQIAPSLVAFNNQLWIAFVAGNATVMVSSSADGTHWSGATSVGESSKFAPSLLSNLPVFGTARPLYKVLTVVYAPPGTNGGQGTSQVDYGSGSSAGTSTSTSKSFKAGVDTSVGISVDLGVVSLGATADFNASRTATNTASLDITKNKNYDVLVKGPAADGIDHDHDLFYLWLNPTVHVQADHLGNLGWNLGIDGPTMNIQYVYAGQLKDSSKMSAGLQLQLKKAGLTEADYAQILSTNPFASDPQATINPDRYLLTTQSFPYEPPYSASDPTPSTTLVQQNTTAQSATSDAETDYSVSLGVSAGGGFGPVSATMSVTGSFQWTDTSSYGRSSTSTQSASVTIGGPAFGYTGPTDVLVYWDTLYNSFMFAFPHTAPSLTGSLLVATQAAAPLTPVTLTTGGHTFQTLTGRDGQYRIYGAPTGPAKVSVGAQQMSVIVGSAQTVAPLQISA